MGYFIHFLALAVNCKLQKYLFIKDVTREMSDRLAGRVEL